MAGLKPCPDGLDKWIYAIWRTAPLAASLALLAGCGLWQGDQPPGTLFVSGRIEGDEADIGPKLAGRIVEITVREGDTVKAGQVLARLDGTQTQARFTASQARLRSAEQMLEQARLQVPVLEERLRQSELLRQQAQKESPGRVLQAEAQVAAARAQLARAQAELEQSRADAVRYSNLAEKGAAPVQVAEQFATKVETSEALAEAAKKQVAAAEASLEVARSTLTNPEIREAEAAGWRRQITEARARVRQLEAEVEAARAGVEEAQASVDDLEVHAPFDGTVITRAAEPGRVVGAGTPILTILDLSALYLRGFVPEGDIGLVKPGQRAEVFLDSAPEEAIPAEVMRIDPEAMFTPENTYFQDDRVKQVVGLKLRLLGGLGAAKPGMPADGRIHVTSQPESP